METLDYWLQNTGISVVFILLGGALLYYIGGWIVAFFTKQLVRGKGRKQSRKDVEKRQNTLIGLTVALWRILVLVIAGLSIFKVFFPAFDLSPLFASAGIIGVAIAFGSQTLVRDLLTGLFIVSENQYRVGDVVEINGAEGRVERVGTRSTVVRDFNGDVHYLPNGSITHVINKTMGYSRVNFSLSLASNTDLDAAITVIDETGAALAKHKDWQRKIIEAPHFDSIGELSGASITITIVGKVQPSDQWRVTAEMRQRLLVAFEKHSIELA